MSKFTIIHYIYSSVYFVYIGCLKNLLRKFKNSILDLGRSLPFYNNNNKLQLGCHPVAVIILHVNKT